MSLKNVGENSAQEFFETIIYMTAYDEARTQISSYTKDIDNPILQEAIEGAMNVLVFGMVFKLIQTQESFINYIFDVSSSVITALLIAPMNKIKNKLRKVKGVGLINRLGIFGSTLQERATISQTVATLASNQIRGQGVQNTSNGQTSTFDTVMKTKDTLYNREKLHMDLGSNMAGRYNETLLFKLLTKSFTPSDEMLVKKILGRDTAAAINMEDLNKVADFMYATDTSGNPIGLSEAFVDLVNGLGFLHNK